jgi:hypothetical protein
MSYPILFGNMASTGDSLISLPTAYQTFINNRTSGTVRYVNYSLGNDSNNGLSKTSAKKTISAAVQSASNNDTIVLSPEVHVVTGDAWNRTVSGGGGQHAVLAVNYGRVARTNLWFVGYPGKTVIATSQSTITRDMGFFLGYDNCGVMGCILEKRASQGTDGELTANYHNGIWQGSTWTENDYGMGTSSANRPLILNCVLKNTHTSPVYNPAGNTGTNILSWVYNNRNDGYGGINNSLIYFNGTWQSGYSGVSGNGVTFNDSITSGSTVDDVYSTYSNIEESVSIDTSFWGRTGTNRGTDTNNRGPFSGTYSWANAFSSSGYSSRVFDGVNW